MNVVFISNYFNHHQKGICDALYRLTSGRFTFIATHRVSETRKKLGYKEMSADYVVLVTQETYEQVLPLIAESDVLIAGTAPKVLIKDHIRLGKPLFRYSERPLKNGNTWYKYPIRWWRWHRDYPTKAQIYMLCASAYTASDYAKFGLFKGKAFKWGYFTECVHYDNIDELMQSKDLLRILWCGRFLDWKHPDAALKAAKRLKDEGYRFRLDMIGTGEMEQQLHCLAGDLQIADVVSFHGSKTPEEVRNAMERAGIYLFTSDRKEGWGAVLNEAMNSGCAVIASLDAGSTPYLVEDGENGLTYACGNDEALYRSLRRLLDDPQEQKRLGRNAYGTILREWNPETAAERLYDIFNRLLEGRDINGCFEHGPCSRA